MNPENCWVKKGMFAKSLRIVLGPLIIRKRYGYFAPSLLVEFRKRLTEEILGESNEMIIEFNKQEDDHDDDDQAG